MKTEYITLEKFRASCRLVADLSEVTQQSDHKGVQAFVYTGGAYIETSGLAGENKLHLNIERESWLRPNTPAGLADLEAILYDYSNGEFFNYGVEMLAFECEGFSDLDSQAKGIFSNVLEVIQECEELGFPDREYIKLMHCLAIETSKRAATFQAQCAYRASENRFLYLSHCE